MKFKVLCLALLATSGLMGAQGVFAQTSESGVRKVGAVTWKKVEQVDVQQLVAQDVPENASRLFFLRQKSNDGLQTSANVAINDRFQISLQPGNFSYVDSCVGVNQLSAEITGHKTNDLRKNSLPFKLESKESYFFLVDVDSAGNAAVKQITKQSALEAMKSMQLQTHQISRVIPNCTTVPEPSVAPVAPIQVASPKLESIELKVLFDNDKSFVKEVYYPEIQRVADFMTRHPQTTATIEGHTDSNASAAYNVALSQRRVDAVKKVLVDKFGITADRLNSIGYGESRPVASNSTVEGRQKNRRVIAVFSEN